jgi:hypothetical protein
MCKRARNSKSELQDVKPYGFWSCCPHAGPVTDDATKATLNPNVSMIAKIAAALVMISISLNSGKV